MSVPTAYSTGLMALSIKGMTCQGCVRRATDAIQGVAGVASVTVELSPGRATVRWQPGATPDAAAVTAAVRRAGFKARLVATAADDGCSCHASETGAGWSPLEGWRFNVVFGGAVTVALALGEWVLGLGMTRWYHWLAFALTLPVQVICGARFYRGAWNQLRVGASNMDTLVALGSMTAFAYSAWGLFAGWTTHLYFMEAAAIIALISTGHWLEAQATERAASSLRALLNLAPPTARRLDAAGGETEVPVAQLAANDRVALRPGDRVPTDGEVLEGQSAVDEAMLTGESLPVEKTPGAKLYAGTVNQNGRLVARVTATGEATALAHIIAIVQRAQNSRAAIQKLGDRVSSVFVPAVVLVALATAFWWGLAPASARSVSAALQPWLWPAVVPATPLAAAFIQAAAILIVACPCAMGLATPAAIMAGTNAAARRGILIRDAGALEKSGRITAVVFDKTGTLTQGKVAVAARRDFRSGADSPPLEALAAALAAPSNHPLSRAIAQNQPATGKTENAIPAPALAEWQEIRGRGVQAGLNGATLRLGSLGWLGEDGVALEAAGPFVAEWTAQGATVLGLASDRRLLGLFALRDTLKPKSAEVVTRLKRAGKAVYLVTGDQAAVATAIAGSVGIPAANVLAEIRPEQKADIVRQLQERGQRIAFVGDGINDAPALAQADLGIAVSRASDVAREAADIILLRSDIEAIPEALGLAQATLRTIRQNLFWAFFYNAAAVPLAALGFLSPVLSAAAMGFSDLLVIGNALRLRRWRP
jgi:Cu+-exporting ATPase